jgi:putative YpdA family bacillithiol system oxidoreductase
MYDIIIIGCGPSGLAAALSAKRVALDFLVLERGFIANTVYNYPIARPLFSTSNEIELEPGALPIESKPTREDVLAHYANVITRERINIRTGEDVHNIVREGDFFAVLTSAAQYKARRVLVATGGFGRQRLLNVPGETTDRVSYRFTEAHPYALKQVLVIGGGNSAAEAALFLAESGANVTLSLRQSSLDAGGEQSGEGAAANRSGAKIKPWVREPLERAASKGRIRIIPSSEVKEILPYSVILQIAGNRPGEIVEIECDHIFALIGADPDTKLLEQAGVEIAPDGRPVYGADTYETNIPGLYVVGHITRELHMKNAIEIGRRVIDLIASSIIRRTVYV